MSVCLTELDEKNQEYFSCFFFCFVLFFGVCVRSIAKIECLVENLNCLLRPGGYFFGIAVDFSSVWFQYQHAISKQPSVESSKVFSGKLFRCVLEELESCKLEGSRIPNVSLEIVDEETKIRCYPFLFSSFMK